MVTENASVQHLMHRCLSHFEEVVRLSGVIADLIAASDIERVESLLTSRGKEIEALAELEHELGRIQGETSAGLDSNEIALFKEKRDKLFRDIQGIDKQVNQSIIASKEAVLTEMKELYRGKRMNDRYVNASTFASGFIDIKE